MRRALATALMTALAIGFGSLRLCHAQSSAAPADPPEAPPPPATAPTSQRFGAWSTVRTLSAEQTICFALARARDSSEAGGNGTLVYVTSWPQAGIKAEVSIRAAQALSPGGAVTLSVGTRTFPLQIRGERAFVASPIEELKLLEAMKKGSEMILVAHTVDGTAARETFSLSGLAAALAHVTQGCP